MERPTEHLGIDHDAAKRELNAEHLHGGIVSELAYYPVKSMAGSYAESIPLDERGVLFDRRWVVVDEAGRFLSQRGKPELATLYPRVTPRGLEITDHAGEVLTVGSSPGTEIHVQVWSDREIAAIDQGDEAAEWLTDRLNPVRPGKQHRPKPVRLARLSEDATRLVKPRYLGWERPVGFADAFPFLITNEASLRDLNSRIADNGGRPVPMHRFRPNIMIDAEEPYIEDTWEIIAIGDAVFYLAKPCDRCPVTTTDQSSGYRDRASVIDGQKRLAEPLGTLGEYRMYPGFDTPLFGWNAVHLSGDSLSVGERVEVIKYRHRPYRKPPKIED